MFNIKLLILFAVILCAGQEFVQGAPEPVAEPCNPDVPICPEPACSCCSCDCGRCCCDCGK